jgi:hypothetical protein
MHLLALSRFDSTTLIMLNPVITQRIMIEMGARLSGTDQQLESTSFMEIWSCRPVGP